MAGPLHAAVEGLTGLSGLTYDRSMVHQVNIHEAKTHFSKLVEEVENGGEVVVARAGKPILRLVKVEEVPTPRQLGFAKDCFVNFSQQAWDELDADVAAMFDWSKLDRADTP